MKNPSCIFYTETGAELSSLARRLQDDDIVDLGLLTHDPGAFLEEVRDNRPDLVVADLGDEPDRVLDLLEKLPSPRSRLIVIGPQDRSGPILRAMRMGVREYLDQPPSEDELRAAVARLASDLDTEPPAAEVPARVVAVMGAKGGVGATVVACQLAATLRRGGARTALVDLNLPLGDVALHFDVQPSYTLANIARESDRLDATYLRTLLQGRPDGVQILASPTHAEEAELVRGVHVERALSLMRDDFEWIVLDVSRTWSEPTMRALDLADQILLVTLMDVPTLNHTRQHLDLLERLGHTGRRIRLIANRQSRSDQVTEKDVAEFLDRRPDFGLPNDYPTTLAAVNRGLPVADVSPRSALARAYAALGRAVHVWCDRDPPTPAAGGGLARAMRDMLGRS